MTIDLPARFGGAPALAVPALLGAGVLAQICYPLVTGAARDTLTVLAVVLIAAAALFHAAATRGSPVVLAVFAVTAVGGFAVELLGVHTGVPFGRYEYEDSLGASVWRVPLLIAFAWTMLAWPAALAARRLARTFLARVALGAWALATWDVFLDPQMVAAGHWHWSDPAPHLPGVPDVPLSDYGGWLAVAALMSFALQKILDTAPGTHDDRWPLWFYVWTWASSSLALAAFLGLGPAAVWGFIAMGTVAVPLARSLAGSR